MFIVHEVIETLKNESYQGITYDYSFPCPECVNEQQSDPCLLSSVRPKRACNYKAPFLHCNKYFHATSIQEMQSIMPCEGNSTVNLSHSLRDLRMLKKNLKYDIAFWYCQADAEIGQIKPTQVINAIKENKSYEVWFSSDPVSEKMDKLTSIVKNSKLVVLGLSDSFLKDEKCMQIYELVKRILKADYLIEEFGISHKWLEESALVSVSGDVRVIMQDVKRFKFKINKVFESIERRIVKVKIDRELVEELPDVFISYCWKNSHDAIRAGTKTTKTGLGWMDPRKILKFFEENGKILKYKDLFLKCISILIYEL